MAFPQGHPPFIRTPLTDFSAAFGVVDIQLCGTAQCRKFEMKYFNCLEAYGIEKGYDKCFPYFEDHIECKYGEKQRGRMKKIRQEVEQQVKDGKRSYLEPPELDAYYHVEF